MGNVTEKDAIWTPDEDDKLDPEVWSAMMADSISQGIGKRVAKQEARAGACISLSAEFSVPSTDTLFPLEVSTGYAYSYANFVEGMTLSAGVLQVVTSGLYLLSSSTLMDFDDGAPMDMGILTSNGFLTIEALQTSPTTYASKTMVATAYLTEGDTVHFTAKTVETGRTLNVIGTHLRATMLYAI